MPHIDTEEWKTSSLQKSRSVRALRLKLEIFTFYVSRCSRAWTKKGRRSRVTANYSGWRFDVVVTDITDSGRPRHVYRSCIVDHANHVIFRQSPLRNAKDPSRTMTVISPVDDFDWAQRPSQLLGHGVRFRCTVSHLSQN